VYLGSDKVPTHYYGNFSKNALCTMPASVVLDSGSVALMSPIIVKDYVYLHYQRNLVRLECFLEYSSSDDPHKKQSASMRMAISDLVPELSVIYDFYHHNMLYLGKIFFLLKLYATHV